MQGILSHFAARAPPEAPAQAPARTPPKAPAQGQWWNHRNRRLHSIGVLKRTQDPHFEFFEWHYKQTLHRLLVWDWKLLQSGYDDRACRKWVQCMKVLELDRKATRDMFLLAISGIKGRALANKLLFELLINHATKPEYEDLSNLVSSRVHNARQWIDRPPRTHEDMQWWDWHQHELLVRSDRPWQASQVPAQAQIPNIVGSRGEILEPPQCWNLRHLNQWV